MRTREVWKTIPDFKNYEVSNLGRLRSKDRYVKNSRSDSLKLLKGKLRSTKQTNTNKYITVSLCIDGKTYYRQMHRLVLETFSGYRGEEVNHKNFNKHDNRLTNLEWVTSKENSAHAQPRIKYAKGETAGKSSITEEQAKKILKLRRRGMMYKDIAFLANTTNKIVGDICRGRTWKHLQEGES